MFGRIIDRPPNRFGIILLSDRSSRTNHNTLAAGNAGNLIQILLKRAADMRIEAAFIWTDDADSLPLDVYKRQLTGNVDLSVGSVVALVSAVCGHLIVNLQMPVMPTVLIAMCCGILMGAFQGFWIAYIRIPAFIVTLAGMLIFRGFTMIILQGRTLAPFPDSYSYMAAGYLSRHLVGTVDMVCLLYTSTKVSYPLKDF